MIVKHHDFVNNTIRGYSADIVLGKKTSFSSYSEMKSPNSSRLMLTKFPPGYFHIQKQAA